MIINWLIKGILKLINIVIVKVSFLMNMSYLYFKYCYLNLNIYKFMISSINEHLKTKTFNTNQKIFIWLYSVWVLVSTGFKWKTSWKFIIFIYKMIYMYQLLNEW